jgi:hypothetical protein
MKDAKRKSLIDAKRKSVAVKRAAWDYLDENLTDDQLLEVYQEIGGTLRMALREALDYHRLVEVLAALESAGMKDKRDGLKRVIDKEMRV